MHVEELDERDLLSSGILPVWRTSGSRSPTTATSPLSLWTPVPAMADATGPATSSVQRHIAGGAALVHNESQNGNLSSSFKSKMASRRPIHRGRHGGNGTATANAAEREAAAGGKDDNATPTNSLHELVRPARTSGFATLRAPRDVLLACSLVREPGFIGRYSNSFTLQSEGPKSVPSQSLVLRVSLLITVVLDGNVL